MSCLISLALGFLTVHADDFLHTSSLRVTINAQTGRISQIDLKNQLDNSTTYVSLLNDGNFLSLDWLIQPELIAQTFVKTGNRETTIESLYNIQGLTINRQIKSGSIPYSLIISYEIKNTSFDVIDLTSILQDSFHFGEGFTNYINKGGGYGAWIYAYNDLFIVQGKDATRLNLKMLSELPNLNKNDWLGWVNRYYVIATRLVQLQDSTELGIEYLSHDENINDEKITPAMLSLKLGNKNSVFIPSQLGPGDTTSIVFENVVAPKQWSTLSLFEPSLDGVILINLWDWFRWVCYGIWLLIDFLFLLTGNWGATIILTALMIRIITIPITRISLNYQEQANQQQERIRPLVRALKEKYTGLDLSEQMLALYKKEKYDQLVPFKSMLGLFVQIPIFIAIFNVLGEAYQLNGVSFLWIENLALSDQAFSLGIEIPFFGSYFNILPFLMAAVMIGSSYYSGKASDNSNLSATSLFGMAIIFFILLYSFPSALVLYWLCLNTFQLLQQVIEHKIKRSVV